ncbi:hypothetical protein A6V39_00600 [Candidatus Mycoplasma haematobovis]|uniref:Uncharacterized protein n=1 Tax=Candidatus Mycoplasma haematobovis TaxID=432608 RepID=A0A1A9QFS8_9MOLU|nr:hypothetical protein [Candidatus Mycoplasma haematobovis]OAL10550.1 hypothetical protein A6V39_00600 [Candidatus Mycoplasma haematobovis]
MEITNYDDPIWDEEFERYKKETNNEDGLKSAKELRNKCKELFETKFDESNDDLLSFDEDFCIGKTKLSKWINDKGKKIVDFEKDKSIWTRLVSSNPENQQKAKEIKIIENISDSNDWEQKMIDYCKGTDWNQEIRKVDYMSIIALCTI